MQIFFFLFEHLEAIVASNFISWPNFNMVLSQKLKSPEKRGKDRGIADWWSNSFLQFKETKNVINENVLL